MLIIEEGNKIAVKKAAQMLKNGEVISFATDTVYALACDSSNDEAIKKLYSIKKRNVEKPISILINNLKIAESIFDLTKIEKKISQHFMPGGLTLVVTKKPSSNISKLLNNNSETIGFRIPNHKFSLDLLNEFGGAIAATSANISSFDPAILANDVIVNFSNKISLVINGGICQFQTPSTVLKIENNNIKIIREGLITEAEIVKIVNEIKS